MANYDLEVINGIIQVSLYFEIGFKDINIKPVDKMNPHLGRGWRTICSQNPGIARKGNIFVNIEY